MDLFAICFGSPRPFHQIWLRQASALPVTFHLMTDRAEEWRRGATDTVGLVFHDCQIDE